MLHKKERNNQVSYMLDCEPNNIIQLHGCVSFGI